MPLAREACALITGGGSGLGRALSLELASRGARVAVAYTLHAHVNERDVAVRGVMRFDVRDGLIARRVDYWDSTVFLRQAGLESA